MNYDNRLGEKIRLLRRQKGMSQEELADKLMITRQSISKWESGDVKPTMENLEMLCSYFGVSHVDLIKEIAQDGMTISNTHMVDDSNKVIERQSQSQPTIIAQNITQANELRQKHSVPYLALAIISLVLFVFSIVVTWCVSRLVFISDSGYMVESNFRLDEWSFVLSIIVNIFFLVSTIFLFIKKYNRNDKDR